MNFCIIWHAESRIDRKLWYGKKLGDRVFRKLGAVTIDSDEIVGSLLMDESVKDRSLAYRD